MANPTTIASVGNHPEVATRADLRSIGATSVNDEPVKEMPRRWSGARLGMEIKYAQQLTLYDFEINPMHWPSSMPAIFLGP